MKKNKKVINYDKFGNPIFLEPKKTKPTNIDENNMPVYPKKEKYGLNDRDER